MAAACQNSCKAPSRKFTKLKNGRTAVMGITKRLKAWIKKAKFRKKRELVKKVRTLVLATYRYYLTFYLLEVEKNKIVDLPAFEYLSGRVVCTPALNRAIDDVENVVNKGVKHINRCYKSYLKQERAILKG